MEATKPYPPYSPGPCVLSYRASLDVPRVLAQTVARLLFAHRARIGTRRGRRSMGCFAQAVLLLRFMRQRAAVADLARDNTIIAVQHLPLPARSPRPPLRERCPQF